MAAEPPTVLRYLRRVLDDPSAKGGGDADLLRRFVVNRDETAFELLLWRHSGMVLGVCRNVLRDDHLAEDAFQATFLALARKAASIGRREAVGGWLYRVAYHAALKARARLKGQPLTEPDALPAPEPAEADLNWRDLGPVVHEELNRLPANYRTALVLCYLEGQTHADAARQLGWPKGTVSGRLARARDMLRKRLSRRGVALSAALLGTGLTAGVASASPALVTATVRGSLAFAARMAADVSPSVIQLTEGVLRTMFLSKLKSVFAVGVVLAGVVMGAGLLGGIALAQKPGPAKGEPPSAGGDSKPGAPDAPAARKMRERSLENLKLIGVAVHNFHDAMGHFPNDVLGKDGKPLLSWRVLLLPYMEEDNLYKQFKLDEPWDSENNLKLLAKMPDVFKTGTEGKDATSTYYQGFLDKNSVFPPGGKVQFQHITDGTSNTVLVVEAGAAVPWTKPGGLPYTSNKPLPKLGGPFGDVATVFCDGAVHVLKKDFDEKSMRLAITRDDGEFLDLDALRVAPPQRPKDNKPQPNQDDELKRALEEAARQAAIAAEQEAKARQLAEIVRREAERARADALAQAERGQVEAAKLKEENERLKAALREIAAQIQKMAPRDDKQPAGDVKQLAAELEKTRAELHRLREEVERLKKQLDK